MPVLNCLSTMLCQNWDIPVCCVRDLGLSVSQAKFNWNYGSSMMWDLLCGTEYEGCMQHKKARQGQSQLAGDGGGGGGDGSDWREEEAVRQAALVGGDTGGTGAAGGVGTRKRR